MLERPWRHGLRPIQRRVVRVAALHQRQVEPRDAAPHVLLEVRVEGRRAAGHHVLAQHGRARGGHRVRVRLQQPLGAGARAEEDQPASDAHALQVDEGLHVPRPRMVQEARRAQAAVLLAAVEVEQHRVARTRPRAQRPQHLHRRGHREGVVARARALLRTVVVRGHQHRVRALARQPRQDVHRAEEDEAPLVHHAGLRVLHHHLHARQRTQPLHQQRHRPLRRGGAQRTRLLRQRSHQRQRSRLREHFGRGSLRARLHRAARHPRRPQHRHQHREDAGPTARTRREDTGPLARAHGRLLGPTACAHGRLLGPAACAHHA
ncbi:hypothetical protein COSO111634_17570 [Corallococcus soli]